MTLPPPQHSSHTALNTLLRELQERNLESIYDVGWLARVPGERTGSLRWPELLERLIETQGADGSWAGDDEIPANRLHHTISALLALHGGRGPRDAVKRGLEAVRACLAWRQAHLDEARQLELVGQELIIPGMLAIARDAGLDVPDCPQDIAQRRQRKLALIPQRLLVSPHTTACHVQEHLGEGAPLAQLAACIHPATGAIGCSPAATAAFLIRGGRSEEAVAYLDRLVSAGCVPSHTPCRSFVVTWALLPMLELRVDLRALVPPSIVAWLRAELTPEGIGFGRGFPPDVDITSVTVRLLGRLGVPVDGVALLRRFEAQDRSHFLTYSYERNASNSANAHALMALAELAAYPDRELVSANIGAFLLGRREPAGCWRDKWHRSPLYATCEVLIALLGAPGRPVALGELSDTVDWLVETQNLDGSWGMCGEPTLEESSYALRALHHLVHQVDSPVLRECMARGRSWFLQRLDATRADPTPAAWPPLWLAKVTYRNLDVVRASVLCAEALCRGTCVQGRHR